MNVNSTIRRKLTKYTKQNRIKKLKEIAKRHDVNLVKFTLKRKNSLLHLACSRGSDVIVRYLLKAGADPLIANKYSQLPIHLAIQFASHGNKNALNDVVAPIIDVCPQCLYVPDARGKTASRMLEELNSAADINSSSDADDDGRSQSDGSSSCSELEDVWYRKLADELDDEYNCSWGNLEQDYSRSDRDHETYDQWADRMTSERASRKRQFAGKNLGTAHRADAAAAEEQSRSLPKISQEKRRKFEKTAAEAARLDRRRRAVERKLKYEAACSALYKIQSDTTAAAAAAAVDSVTYEKVPWPYVSDGASVLPAGDALRDSVVNFLFEDMQPDSDEYRSYLKVQRLRWHPDRFVQKCGAKLAAGHERERILLRVNEISQILNDLYSRLNGASSS